MKSIKKIVHEVQFGKYRQEWELSFDYDDETVENVKIIANNYDDNGHISWNEITKVLPKGLVDAMIDSIDLDEERNSEIESAFDSKFDDIKSQLNNL